MTAVPSRGVHIAATRAQDTAAGAVAGAASGARARAAGGLDPTEADLLQPPVSQAIQVDSQPGGAVVGPQQVLVADVAGVTVGHVAADASHQTVVGEGSAIAQSDIRPRPCEGRWNKAGSGD